MSSIKISEQPQPQQPLPQQQQQQSKDFHQSQPRQGGRGEFQHPVGNRYYESFSPAMVKQWDPNTKHLKSILSEYIGDLKSGLVWISTGQKEVGLQMIQILNGI